MYVCGVFNSGSIKPRSNLTFRGRILGKTVKRLTQNLEILLFQSRFIITRQGRRKKKLFRDFLRLHALHDNKRPAPSWMLVREAESVFLATVHIHLGGGVRTDPLPART